MLMLVTIFQLLSYSRGNLIRPTLPIHDSVTSALMPEATSPSSFTGPTCLLDDVLSARDLASVTCGYYDYDPAWPLACPGDRACGYDNRPGQPWGPACCSTQSNGDLAPDCTTSMVTTCLDHSDTRNFLAPSEGQFTSERTLYW